MVWLYGLSTTLLYLTAAAAAINVSAFPDECLIVAANHNGGVNVTATLRSGFTVTQHFPNNPLPQCGDDVRCPTIIVDQANDVNITDAVAIVQVESGLLLFSIHYNGTLPLLSLEITDSYTVQLPCKPLAVLPSNIPSVDYLIVCYQDATMEIRRLNLNSTNLAGSIQLLIFSDTLFQPSLNRSLLSNFLTKSAESVLFGYRGDLYQIRTGINDIRSLGALQECQDTNKIKPVTDDKVVAFCSDRIVLFSVTEGQWIEFFLEADAIELNKVCPGSPGGQLILSTSMILYPGNITCPLPAPYGSQLVCIGTNGRTFLVYKDNSSLSNVWLVELTTFTSVQLTEEDCSSNTEIVTFQGRYVVVSNRINGACNTVLFDIVNNAPIPVVSQPGQYPATGIITGFIQTPAPTTQPPSTTTTTEMLITTFDESHIVIGVIGGLLILFTVLGAIIQLICRWWQCRSESDPTSSDVTLKHYTTSTPAVDHNKITTVPVEESTQICESSLCVPETKREKDISTAPQSVSLSKVTFHAAPTEYQMSYGDGTTVEAIGAEQNNTGTDVVGGASLDAHDRNNISTRSVAEQAQKINTEDASNRAIAVGLTNT